MAKPKVAKKKSRLAAPSRKRAASSRKSQLDKFLGEAGLSPPRRLPTSWSLSRYEVWRGCPRQYLLGNVLRLPTPPHAAMDRGIAVHLKGESYLRGDIPNVPKEYQQFRTEMRKLRDLGVTPEQDWTITEQGKRTKFDDWNNAWLRAKIDAHHYFDDSDELLLVDFKTGRVNVKIAQAELYAWMGGMYFYPKAKRIEVEFWFLDHGEPEVLEFERKDIPDLNKKWRERAGRMLAEREFLPTPGNACDRCPFRSDKEQAVRTEEGIKAKGGGPGPCDAWKRRDK